MGTIRDDVPPLRRDLRFEHGNDGVKETFRIVDERLGRTIKLDDRGRDLVSLLDHEQSFEDLARRIEESTGTPMEPEALRRVLRALDGLGLLEGREEEVEAHETVGAGNTIPEDIPLIVPEDLRFTCSGCGSCCVGVNVGPVLEPIAANITSKFEELSQGQDLKKSPFFRMVPEGDEEGEVLVCQTRNGACIFLDPDGLCRVHKKFGKQAKPGICRLFPYRFVLTPQGLRVSLQTECRDILRASLGQPVREQEEELRQLLALLPKVPVVRPFLSLDGEVTLSYGDFLALEAQVLEAVEKASERGPYAMLCAVVRTILGRCRAADLDNSLQALRKDLYQTLQDVGELLLALKRRYQEESYSIEFHAENLDLVVEALRDAPLFARSILSEVEGEGKRFAKLVILNFIRGHEELLGPKDLLSAVGHLAFAWFVTMAVAVSRARQVHRLALYPQDLVDGWVVTHMLLRNHRVAKALSPLEERIRSLFAYRLDALVGAKEALEMASPKTDFHLF